MLNTPHTSPFQPNPPRRPVGLALIVVFALLLGLSPAGAQESIEDARQRREDAREAELQARAARDVLQAEWEDIQNAFEAADELVRLSKGRAEAVQAQLELVQIRLRRTEVGIAWAEYDRARVDEQLTDLAIQEYLGVRTEESPLESGNLNETLTRNTVLDVVQGAGNDAIDTARSAADRQQALQEQAEFDIAEVKRLQAELLEETADLEAARATRAKARDALDARLEEWGDVIEEWETIEQDLTDFIRVEQERIEVQSRLDAVRSSEGYVWPTAGGIGSYFGYRRHPILGYSRLHGGLDIGGSAKATS